MFASDGSYVDSWAAPPCIPSSAFRPRAIAVGSGLVYTAQDWFTGETRVLCFDTAGSFVRQWTVSGRVLSMDVTDDGGLVAAIEPSRVVEFDQFGRPVDTAQALPAGHDPLGRPTAVSVRADRLFVADASPSRVVVFRQRQGEQVVTAFSPTLLPACPGAVITLAGHGIPEDLRVWLSDGQQLIEAESTWVDPGRAEARFDLSSASGGTYRLFVSGSGLPQTQLGQAMVTSRLDARLVGNWRVEEVVGAGEEGEGMEVLRLSPDGTAAWERLDGEHPWKTGWWAASEDDLTLVYSTGRPNVPLGTESYRWMRQAEKLTLTGEPPASSPVQISLQLVDEAALIEPSIAGRWRLVRLREHGQAVNVDWDETMSVCSAGTYTIVSDRHGEWAGELGQLQAHTGAATRIQQAAWGRPLAIQRVGTYTLDSDKLTLSFDSPEEVIEEWERISQPGARPLLWVCAEEPQAVLRGAARTLNVYVGNHGNAPATNVVVTVRLPWATSSDVAEAAHFDRLQPGQVEAVAVTLTPPAQYGRNTARIVLTVSCAGGEEQQSQWSARLPVVDAVMDLAVAVVVPPSVRPGAAAPVDIIVASRGLEPRTAVTGAQRLERALIMRVPQGTSVTAAVGHFDGAEQAWWMSWAELINQMNQDLTVLRLTLRPPAGANPGTVLSGSVQLCVPAGLEELSPADNAATWRIGIATEPPPVQLAANPPFLVAPGQPIGIGVCLMPRSEQLHHQATILYLDPQLDLPGSPVSVGAELDIPHGRLVIRQEAAVAPGQTFLFSQLVSTPPWSSRETEFTFGGVAYLASGAELLEPVRVGFGRRVGDINADGMVDYRDMAAFIGGWRQAVGGTYDPSYDIGPVTGSWPDVVSAPDGVIDNVDAAVMLQALLGALMQR